MGNTQVQESHISRNIQENISTIFLLPCLKLRQEVKNRFYQMGFINTYMFWYKHQGEYGEYTPLYLLFEPLKYDIDFYKFSQILERNQNHIETIDNSNGSVVFIFRIPKRFMNDYELFKQGKYSKFSGEFKGCFDEKRYVIGLDGKIQKDEQGKYITEYSMFYHLFNKTLYMQNLIRERYGEDIELPDELYEKYRPERETLNY